MIQHLERVLRMDIQILEDPKEKIQFWVDIYKLDGISRETKNLVEICLQNEIRNYNELPRLMLSKEVIEKVDKV